MGEHGIPSRIETERLVLRCWTEADTTMAREAVDASLAHLRPWVDWAMNEPRSMDETRELLRWFAQTFEAGENFQFGVFNQDESKLVGGGGLLPIGGGGLEIAYWIRVDQTRAGFATETAQALTAAGLAAPGFDWVQLSCDAGNEGSRRVAEKLGYRLVETREDRQMPTGPLRDTLVFEIRLDGSQAE